MIRSCSYLTAVIAVLTVCVSSFNFGQFQYSRSKTPLQSCGWRRFSTIMSDPVVEETSSVTSSPVKQIKADFSSFAIDQEYEGKVMSAKNFGIFVDIASGYNVLLPRSLISNTVYERLKKMATDKSAELIKIAIVGLSAENQTLSGKYIPPAGSGKDRSDLSSLSNVDLKSKMFNATIVSSHEFGVFAVLDDLNVEGLVPASKIPSTNDGRSIKDTYKTGMKVIVQVADVNTNDKKLILSMKISSRPGVEAFSSIPPSKWFQGIIQSVASFGLFVRPAGFDSVGLVHVSQIPRDLVSALKKRVQMPEGTNKTDVEILFSEGDVIKCRVQEVDASSKKLELSMLPMKSSEDDDDYIVPGRDPEGEEEEMAEKDKRDEEQEFFDAEETLLWWKGSPYTKLASSIASSMVVDEEIEVVNESTDVIEGTWRRMFELDLREDESEFSSKIAEQELAELAEEIGELEGLAEDMSDSLGFGIPYTGSRMGLSIPKSLLPSDWTNEIEFFRETEESESAILSSLKGGKKAEQLEFEKLLTEVEREIASAANRGGGRSRDRQAEAEVEAAAASVDPVTSAVAESSTAIAPEQAAE